MRLLRIQNDGNFTLVECNGDVVPPYAILSHTWGASSEEVTYQDLLAGMGNEKIGYRKLSCCAKQAAKDGWQYFWVDTCCIDKTSSSELSEAIILCTSGTKQLSSKWFTRGWTLQELVAPAIVVFFNEKWDILGSKAELNEVVSQCTRIPMSMLLGTSHLEAFSIAQRMLWAAVRQTTRIEDEAYCLMGIFEINMPLIYGEGENAFLRLQEEIMKISDDYTLFAWRSSDNRGGCLATSPASFFDSYNIVHSEASDMSYEPAIVSSRGVYLDLRLVGCDRGRVGVAILNGCKRKTGHGDGDEFVAIYLRDKGLKMKRFERIWSEEFAQFNIRMLGSAQYPIRRLCIQKGRITRTRTKTHGEAMSFHSSTIGTGGSQLDLMGVGNSKTLLEAVHLGNEDYVWVLLTRKDINVNEKDGNKQTALSYAAIIGNKRIASMILNQSDVDPNLQDVHGHTPLSLAADMGHGAIVKLLLESGKVDVNMKDDNYRRTPLTSAAGKGHEVVVKMLLETFQVDINLKDGEFKRTPLTWAAEKGHEPVVKLLLGTGQAEVNLSDQYGRTPLSWAAMKGYEVVVKLLLETDLIDINSKDKHGRTPLWWAIEKGHEAVVRLLLETGKVDAKSKYYQRWASLKRAASS